MYYKLHGIHVFWTISICCIIVKMKQPIRLPGTWCSIPVVGNLYHCIVLHNARRGVGFQYLFVILQGDKNLFIVVG